MQTDTYQIAYMDETGHAADDVQRFCGMAGFITTVDRWQLFEDQWNSVLTKYGVGYMHMRGVRARPQGISRQEGSNGER